MDFNDDESKIYLDFEKAFDEWEKASDKLAKARFRLKRLIVKNNGGR
jgi:hypothetical protein